MSDPEPPFVIGIDAGGTKTVCYLADGQGVVLDESRAGGANLQAVGELALEKTLYGAMADVIGRRQVTPAAVCLGIAGVDRVEDAAVVREIMNRIGHQARITVTNDALVALVAGVGQESGVVIVAGTGSMAYGRNARGIAARAGGWGHVLGDEGSGYWMGRRALRAVVREADGRGPATSMTPAILQQFEVRKPQALIHEIYARRVPPSTIAALAVHVGRAASGGDGVATRILEAGASELISAAASVVARLDLAPESFTFVLAGGMFNAVPSLADMLASRLPAVAPSATVVRLEREPAWGAVCLALADLRGQLVLPTYAST